MKSQDLLQTWRHEQDRGAGVDIVGKVLVIKLGALGDVVMATPLLAAIARHHLDDELTLMTTPAFAPLFADWRRYRVKSVARRGWRNNLEVVTWLRAMRFDRIYDLQANDRTGVWCALSGTRERVGNHNRYPYTHHPADAWRGQSHIFERMRAVLASAGIHDIDTRPCLPADDATRARVAAWCAAHPGSVARRVLLHAGASATRPEKIWPHFAGLAARLVAQGMQVVCLGAEPDRERNSELARVGGIDATGAFDIASLVELGRHARFAVTNDSGPMHALSAAGIPVFGLFGPSDWRRNHALGQAQHVIACDAHDSNLAALSVDAVWSRLAAAGVLGDERGI
jgi:ADP-heptose:LPS heptosyltransferase